MISRPLRKVRSVNSNAANFTAPVMEVDLQAQSVDPGTAAGRTFIWLSNGFGSAGFQGGIVPKAAEFWPYALGNDNDTFTMRVIGWRRIVPLASDARFFWVPSILCDVLCTASAFVGLAAGPVLNTERFCDTVAKSIEPLKTGNTTLLDGYIKYYSPQNDTPGRFQVPLDGHEVIECQFDQTGGFTPTMNALYMLLDKC